MSELLALGAALLFALGTVLQRHVATTADAEQARRAGFLLGLVRRPVWVAGLLADGLGFAGQAAALALGRLAVVQPLIAASLVFALPLGAALDRRRVARRELLAGLAIAGGLAVFLLRADPAGGRDDASTLAWLAAFAGAVAICVPAWLFTRRADAMRRALLLGGATGVLFGLSAALTKATAARLDDGLLALVTDWHLWALIAVGVVSMSLAQASLQAGPLGAAVATQMALDPITSLALGILAFGERLHTDAAGYAGLLAGLLAAVAGIAALATLNARTPVQAPQR